MKRKPSKARAYDHDHTSDALGLDIDLNPVPEVVAALARVLVEAKAGTVRAVAIAYVKESGNFTGTTSGIQQTPLDIRAAKLLSTAIRELDHEWLHAVRGK